MDFFVNYDSLIEDFYSDALSYESFCEYFWTYVNPCFSIRAIYVQSIVAICCSAFNANTTPYFTFTPWEVFRKFLGFEEARIILNSGNTPWNINPEKQNMHSKSLLPYFIPKRNEESTSSGFKKVLSKILSMGVDINHSDKNGLTSLHYAAFDASVEEVKELVKNDADISTKDRFGDFPIVYAAASGNCKVLKYLASMREMTEELYNRLLEISYLNGHSHKVSNTLKRIYAIKKTKFNLTYCFDGFWYISRTVGQLVGVINALQFDMNLDGGTSDFGGINSPINRFFHLEEKLEAENYKIKDEVEILIQRISNNIKKNNKEDFLFVLSGSCVEKTKIGAYNEFDYLCIWNIDSSTVQIRPYQLDKQYTQISISNKLCLSSEFSLTFLDQIMEILLDPRIWMDLHLSWDGDVSGGGILTLTLFWEGHNAKRLKISFDLVSTIIIRKKLNRSEDLTRLLEFYPELEEVLGERLYVAKQVHDVKLPEENDSFVQHDNLLVDEFCIPTDKIQYSLWRISFSPIESKLFQLLPQNARDGYKLVKFLRSIQYPSMSTYFIKTVLFRQVLKILEEKSDKIYLQQISAKDWALKVLHELYDYGNTTKRIPNFFLSSFMVNMDTRFEDQSDDSSDFDDEGDPVEYNTFWKIEKQYKRLEIDTKTQNNSEDNDCDNDDNDD